MYRKNSNCVGDEELVSSQENQFFLAAYQWSPDGKFIIFSGGLPSSDISMLTLADHKVTPLIRTAWNELHGAVSPDGKWLAYDSRDTARFEIYITTFPPSSSKWMVTTDGGGEPRWR